MNPGNTPTGRDGSPRQRFIARGTPGIGRGLGTIRLSIVGFGLLAVVSWGFILSDERSGFSDLFRAETWHSAGRFVGELAGRGSEAEAAFLQAGEWAHAGKLATETLAMSVLAMAFAGAGALGAFLPAARNAAMGDLAPRGRWAIPSRALYYFIRANFIFSRGVPELIWAMIIIFFLSPGILPGALALGFHNFGILGKLSSEVVEDMDTRPARALRASGARNFQMMAYAIMPQVLPQFITYALYRWEVVIRTTIVVGFVSAGGLGRDFRLGMSFFHYTDVALLLIWYVLLVIGVDLLSATLRRRVRA